MYEEEERMTLREVGLRRAFDKAVQLQNWADKRVVEAALEPFEEEIRRLTEENERFARLLMEQGMSSL